MNNDKVIEVNKLSVYFNARAGFFKDLIRKDKIMVRAVDGVDLSISKGEIVSLVGESGSGKTTMGRAILNLVHHNTGSLKFNDEAYDIKNKKWMKTFRKKAQMIFQDPYQSLNPKFMIADIVSEPLKFIEKKLSEEEIESKVVEALEFAGLKPARDYLYRYPYELSGGQRQRVAIASVFIISPQFIVADEPVSMLDASVRADIVKLMLQMKEEKGTSYLFITHDLALAWLVSDRIAIMYLGKIVEIGPAEIISGNCIHPYTQALISVLSNIDIKKKRKRIVLKGETPSPMNIPKGCRFHTRCPIAKEKCEKEEPPLIKRQKNHFAACHFSKRLI